MNYKKQTPRLGLPVPWYGDHIIPELEMQRFLVIENMLLAGTKGIRNCMFDDGRLELGPETDKTYVATLQATGNSPSAVGMIGGAFFDAPPILTWPNLEKGYFHYLYLRGSSKTFEDCSAVRTLSSVFLLEGDNLLVATADCRSEQPVIDPYPDGKVYSTDLARHANDMENPHGRTLVQDELFVRKLCLHDPEGNAAEVEVMVDGKPVSIPSSLMQGAALELAGRKVETLDLESAGPQGRVVEVKDVSRVLFVNVARRFTGTMAGTLGEVAVGYWGQDTHLHLPNEFSVYNSGDASIPLRVLVYCG
jgi:hypothetical protein